MKVNLHIGAHKTATTHIQRVLRSGHDWLEERGVTLSTPREVKPWLKDFKRAAEGPWWRKPAARRRVLAKTPKPDFWLLSAENLAGIPGDLLLHRMLFPHLAERISEFQNLFEQPRLRVFLSVRSYDSFFLSNYLEILRNRGYFPFERFYNEKAFSHISWLDPIERLLQVIEPRQLVLWRYEDYRGLEPKVLEQLTERDGISDLLSMTEKGVTRPSLSARAVEVLQKEAPRRNSADFKPFLWELNKRYPAGDKYARFDPWSTEQRQAMQKRYARDMSALKARFPAINLLETDAPGSD